MQIALRKPKLAACTQIGRDRGKTTFAVLDLRNGHDLAVLIEHTLAAQQTAAPPGEIH